MVGCYLGAAGLALEQAGSLEMALGLRLQGSVADLAAVRPAGLRPNLVGAGRGLMQACYHFRFGLCLVCWVTPQALDFEVAATHLGPEPPRLE